METTEAIIIRIQELCKKNEISLNRLATISGLEPSTIKSIFYGKSKNPGINTINAMCDGLGLTLFQFFDCDLFKTPLDD